MLFTQIEAYAHRSPSSRSNGAKTLPMCLREGTSFARFTSVDDGPFFEIPCSPRTHHFPVYLERRVGGRLTRPEAVTDRRVLALFASWRAVQRAP